MTRPSSNHAGPALAVLAVSLALAACQQQPATDPVDDSAVDIPTAPAQIARATLADADGNAMGEAIVAEGDGGLLLTVNVTGATPGVHGIHIHTVGLCEGPAFESAGPHWNPTQAEHGMENPEGAHMGDLPNLTVADDGTGSIEARIEGATLGTGTNSLLDSDGSAFVVHAEADDMQTDPSGNSGDRIACGVFAAS